MTIMYRNKAGVPYICQVNPTCMHEEFHCLDLSERANLVLRQGQHLITTNFYGARVKLYNFRLKYVEVYYHPITQKIMRVSIASGDDMNKHLKSIAI